MPFKKKKGKHCLCKKEKRESQKKLQKKADYRFVFYSNEDKTIMKVSAFSMVIFVFCTLVMFNRL